MLNTFTPKEKLAIFGIGSIRIEKRLDLVVTLREWQELEEVDRIGLERHALSGFAKDLGSAAVLLGLLLVAITWLLVLFG